MLSRRFSTIRHLYSSHCCNKTKRYFSNVFVGKRQFSRSHDSRSRYTNRSSSSSLIFQTTKMSGEIVHATIKGML